MSMTRKLTKKLMAAAFAFAVAGAAAANVSAGGFPDGTVVFGSASKDGSSWTTGGTLDTSGSMMVVANQNTLINWSSANFGGNLYFGATSGVALVNQILTGGPVSLTCTLDQASGPYNAGQVYFIGPYGVSYGGSTISGINVISSAVTQITDQAGFNAFLGNPGGNSTIPDSVLNAANEFTSNLLVGQMETNNAADEAMKALIDAGGEPLGGGDDKAKAAQEALAKAQGNQLTGVSDHVYVVQTGAEQNKIPNITQGLQGLTVQEASARVRSIAKDYMKALNSGNKAEADRLKEALKEANNNVKILKENEKKAKEEAENAANAAQEALLNAQRENEQLEELKELAARAAQEMEAYEKEQQQSQIQQDEEKPSAPPLSELIRQFGTEQQKQALQQQQQKQQQQGGGTVITTAGEQKDAGSKINDLIGTELLEKETTARNKLVKAKTSEEKAEAMKELDEVHKEETEKVNKLLKEQEEKQRIEVMEQQLEAQRRQEEQLKVVGGPEGGEALTRGAKRASDALKKTKDLEKRIDELKKEYDETDKAARKLTDQYYKAKEAGASKEELEKIAKEWNELDQKRSELDKQRDNALVEHMNASDEAAKEAAEYSRLQGIAKEAQQELDKLGLDKAKDDLAAKQAEYDRVSGRDIENGRDSAAEAAMKAVDDKYAAELQSLHQQYDEAINNGTSEDIERASSLLENKNMEVGMEKSEAANKAEEEYMTAERKELLQKLKSDKEAITQAEKNLNEAQQKVSNLEKVESAIREKAQDMLTAPDRIGEAESAQIKAGVDAQVAALQHKSTEREYGFSSMQAGVTRSILNTSKDKYEAATANVNDLREKANYQPGQSANVFSATRQQTEAALKAETGK